MAGGWVCVEPVKDTVVHSAGPGLALTEKTLKAAGELFFGGHCLPFSGDCVTFGGHCPPFVGIV